MARYSRSKLANYISDNIDDQSALADKIAGFLIDIGKTSDLESIMRDVADIRAQKQGVIELTAISAFELNSETRSQIEALVRNQYADVKQIIIHEVIDKTVIGGVNLDFANANLDLTIRNKLNKLREAVA